MGQISDLQKIVWQNKIDKGFNVQDVNKEFCFLYGEIGEGYDAYRKNKEDLGEELADVALYLMGLSEMVGVDLEGEILRKIEKNKSRKYKNVDGILLKDE